MKRNIRVKDPSPEMLVKIRRARHAISSQEMRNAHTVGIVQSMFLRTHEVMSKLNVKCADEKPCSMSSV